MTEQVLKRLFDFQKFAPNKKLEAMIQETQSRQTVSLSESELAYVNAAGVPEMMGLLNEDSSNKDVPWNQH